MILSRIKFFIFVKNKNFPFLMDKTIADGIVFSYSKGTGFINAMLCVAAVIWTVVMIFADSAQGD